MYDMYILLIFFQSVVLLFILLLVTFDKLLLLIKFMLCLIPYFLWLVQFVCFLKSYQMSSLHRLFLYFLQHVTFSFYSWSLTNGISISSLKNIWERGKIYSFFSNIIYKYFSIIFSKDAIFPLNFLDAFFWKINWYYKGGLFLSYGRKPSSK